jgi:hypothetical protein
LKLAFLGHTAAALWARREARDEAVIAVGAAGA